MDDKTTSIPLDESDSKEYEFRIFFPLIKVEDLELNDATSAKYLAYAEGLKALEDEFNGVDASNSKDGGNCVKMVYVIGCDHWGAKFRGEKQKLEVKYRTDMTPLGFTHLACAGNSHLACGILKRFKKKECGKKICLSSSQRYWKRFISIVLVNTRQISRSSPKMPCATRGCASCESGVNMGSIRTK